MVAIVLVTRWCCSWMFCFGLLFV